MPFTIVRQDITQMETEAIVNAANTQLLAGGGVCGAIFQGAGYEKLTEACKKLAPIKTGEAVMTKGFNLLARYIIHTAGPVYNPAHPDECRTLLRNSYRNSLQLAEKHHLKSIAFPLISSGIYGYPKQEAMEVAVNTIADFLKKSDMQVYLTVFDKAAYLISKDLMEDVESFISENVVESKQKAFSRKRSIILQEHEYSLSDDMEPELIVHDAMEMPACPSSSRFDDDLESELRKMDVPFSEMLLHLIDAKGKNDVEVYKKANIDRKLFSKIRKGHGYTPRKPTILALCIALELTLQETIELLARAGYAFSRASKFDIIVEYFITHRRYNIFEINQVLFAYDQPQLG